MRRGFSGGRCRWVAWTWQAPRHPHVRVDTHAYEGYEIPPFYDSLIAKLIVSGHTRQEAIVRAREALESFVIEGISTTIPYLASITRNEAFQAGDVDTGFVERFAAAPEVVEVGA